MKKKKSKKRKSQKTIIIICLAIAIAIVIAVYCVAAIIRQEKKNSELRLRYERLQQLVTEEKERHNELKEEESYIQNEKLKYIEEKAKSIGYIYPDEIIFKEDD